MKVIVAQPSLQHSNQLASALYEDKALAAFWCATPLRGQDSFEFSLNRGIRRTIVPKRLRRHPFQFAVSRRLAFRLFSPEAARHTSHMIDVNFDSWCASRLIGAASDIVIGYENSCMKLFSAAKRAGKLCILDAASIHYRAQLQYLEGTSRADPAWVLERKEEELALADAILVCSEFAKESYVRSGTPTEKIVVCSLGAEVPERPRVEARTGPCKFLFVGAASLVKGVDILLDVMAALQKEQQPADLSLIGGIVDREIQVRLERMPQIHRTRFLSHTQLFQEIPNHDCLVLPSRFDSFGMVVPEAMMLGTPCLVSDRVGAKEIIEKTPRSGWVYPFGYQNLQVAMKRIISNRAELNHAAGVAPQAARAYSWTNYRRRVTQVIRDVWERERSRS